MKYSKSGFTLMELLIYMGIVGVVVIIAGQAFSNSTKFRIRTDNMVKSSHEAEKLASLIKSDVLRTGAKYSKEATVSGNDDSFDGHASNVYMDPSNDLSSFSIVPISTNYDELKFRSIRYDEQGRYQATEEVLWTVDASKKTLKRTCKLLDKLASYNPKRDPCSDENPVEMATGVEKFKIYPAIPTVRSNADAAHQMEQVFPPGGGSTFRLVARTDPNIIAPTSVSSGGTGVTVRGLVKNYDDETQVANTASIDKNELYVATNENVAGEWDAVCYKVTLEDGIEYEISFTMTYPGAETDAALLFVPGRDHMAVGFRKNGAATAVEDFLFYPPTGSNSQGKRTMRFTVPQEIEDACMAFTFTTYSPLAAAGNFIISNFKLNRIAGSNYVFDPTIVLPVQDKKNVKALKIVLEVGRGGKDNKAGETGDIDIVVPIPSNGVGI